MFCDGISLKVFLLNPYEKKKISLCQGLYKVVTGQCIQKSHSKLLRTACAGVEHPIFLQGKQQRGGLLDWVSNSQCAHPQVPKIDMQKVEEWRDIPEECSLQIQGTLGHLHLYVKELCKPFLNLSVTGELLLPSLS